MSCAARSPFEVDRIQQINLLNSQVAALPTHEELVLGTDLGYKPT